MLKRIDKAILLHGYGETPERTWFPWLHRELESRGIGVVVPALPDTLRPNYKKWMGTVLPLAKQMTPTTIVIGHSIGGALAMRMLEKRLSPRIAAAVLIGSPFSSVIRVQAMMNFFTKPIDWLTVRGAAKNFIVVHAKDDPLVPYDHALRYQEALDAALVLRSKGGHFTSKKAPPVLRIVDALLK